MDMDDLRRAGVLGSATLQGELDKNGIIDELAKSP